MPTAPARINEFGTGPLFPALTATKHFVIMNHLIKGLHTPMTEKIKNGEDLQSLLQKWNAEYDELDETQIAGEGGLKELKQSLDKKWTALSKSLHRPGRDTMYSTTNQTGDRP